MYNQYVNINGMGDIYTLVSYQFMSVKNEEYVICSVLTAQSIVLPTDCKLNQLVNRPSVIQLKWSHLETRPN